VCITMMLACIHRFKWYVHLADEWAIQMVVFLSALFLPQHEVGHNMGLTHSADNTDANVEYGDRTGMMGISYFIDDGPSRAKMCFNPAKSYTLEWYSDKNLDIDASATPFCGRLV
jgi:hypothetical protein